MRDLWRDLHKARAQLRYTSDGYTVSELMVERKRDLIRINILRARLGVWKDRQPDSKVH